MDAFEKAIADFLATKSVTQCAPVGTKKEYQGARRESWQKQEARENAARNEKARK